MPVGVIINCLSVVLGGALGSTLGRKLSGEFKDALNLIFGVCSMGMGISTIVLMENMPAVIFATIIGTAIGLWIHLGKLIERGAGAMQRGVSRFVHSGSSMSQEDFESALVTIIVLFCASGTGIYGSIMAGMTGDHSILIAKSILDLFTALIFACSLGPVVSLVALPQGIIFLLLFFAAGLIYPLTTPAMIADFKACGGLIMLATGFRIIKVKSFPIADMLPAMVLVMPLSAFWVNVVSPLVASLV